MKQNIEKRLVQEISPLTEFLGAERVEDLKDKVCSLILNQVESDLRERDQYVLIYEDDIREIVEEALSEVRGKIKRAFKGRLCEIADEAVKFFVEKGYAETDEEAERETIYEILMDVYANHRVGCEGGCTNIPGRTPKAMSQA